MDESVITGGQNILFLEVGNFYQQIAGIFNTNHLGVYLSCNGELNKGEWPVFNDEKWVWQ